MGDEIDFEFSIRKRTLNGHPARPNVLLRVPAHLLHQALDALPSRIDDFGRSERHRPFGPVASTVSTRSWAPVCRTYSASQSPKRVAVPPLPDEIHANKARYDDIPFGHPSIPTSNLGSRAAQLRHTPTHRGKPQGIGYPGQQPLFRVFCVPIPDFSAIRQMHPHFGCTRG